VDAQSDCIEVEEIPELIPKLNDKDEEMKIVIFNGISDKKHQRRMRRRGADGYLSEKSDLGAVVRSVRRVAGLK
jgi:DNA-binding NarL/FixJ family response regulator